MTRKLRIQFELNIVNDIKASPKKFWSYVKSRTKTKGVIPSLKKSDGTEASTPSEKAEVLNGLFASTFTDENLQDFPPDESNQFRGDYLDTFVISKEMVQEKLEQLNEGKTPGPDKWHPVILKNLAEVIAEPLEMLYQKSLNENLVPSQWLKACITAIYKKGSKNEPGNYRPVSMTSIICKLMESLVRDKLVSHMEHNNLFSNSQHGFVPFRNCMTNLLTCIEMWTEMIENGLPIDVIYTDFAKAFDRIPHQRLLLKLKNLGIVGNTLGWIKAFLSGRSQCVRVENTYSSWEPVKSGIPQGSVLGPILFVCFINDLPNVVGSMCQLFADDAKIFRSVKTSDDIKLLQDDINKITAWSKKWQLPFNVDKCKSLHIGNSNNQNIYVMEEENLGQLTEHKDLGVLVDDQLKFHKHTAAAVKKASMVLGLVKKSFALLDCDTVPILYKSLVRPHLEYGNVIWGPFFKEDMKLVEKVQRRATKMITEVKELSYEDRLRALHLPSLLHRRRRGDMICTYKIMTGKVNIDKDDFFKASKLTTRGHKFKIFKQHGKKLPRIQSFSHRIVNCWNKLTPEVVNAPTTNSFKNKLDEHWGSDIYETPF